MRYWLVMPAAGAGRRFAGATPKQYAPLAGRTVMEWALQPFLADARCAGAVVAIAAEDACWAGIAARLGAVRTTPGGVERSDSVRSGLAALAGRALPGDWILVHDAARPCLSEADLDRLLERLREHEVGGLLAVRATDTLKRADPSGAVETTVDRSALWRALTPQMFRYGLLCQALDNAARIGRQPTDEAQAIEWLGARPVLVEGSAANIKITSREDLAVAAALLARKP